MSADGRRRSLILIVVMLLLVAGCRTSADAGQNDQSSSDDDMGQSSGGDATAANEEPGDRSPNADSVRSDIVDVDVVFDDRPCDSSLPLDLSPRCGMVEVPMDWTTGEGVVELAVAVFPSTADQPADDPVVYLEGGPGGHALETLTFSVADLLQPLLARGDVVVFDQRGAGLSTPQLSCSELTEVTRELEDIPIIADEEAESRYYEALSSCHRRLQGDGIDLADFNSFNNAHDTDAIRRALGYDQWNLFGVSYGTKLGLEVMRRHPDGVRSVVLDSVYPPEVDSVAENPQTFIDSYENVSQACRAEPACAAQGDLMARFEGLASDLQANPKQVTVTDFIDGERDQVYLTGDTLVGVVTQALYSPSWFTDLPELATDLEAGGTNVVEQFLSQQRSLERYFTDGMFYAMSCHEEISFADPEAVVDPPDPFGLRDTFDLASNTGSNAFETCNAFPNGQAAAEANQAVVSDIPTLLLAGSFDPVTPVSWARDAAHDLANGHLVVAPNGSHGVFSSECGMSVIVAFLGDPSTSPEGSCLEVEPLRFVGPGAETIELIEAGYVVDGWDLEISTVRPDGWSTGTLNGDQYRRQSFLDPTQLFQLAGDSSLGAGLADFIGQSWNVDLSPPTPFTSPSVVGTIQAADLSGAWERRSGTGPGVMVEWFEAEVGGGTAAGTRVFVILVSSPEEQQNLVEQVLGPALEAIEVRP